MDLDELLDKFEHVKRSGSGHIALCPAHTERRPSLSIAEGDDGFVFHCFAGCSTEDVLTAAGLTWTDVFYEQKERIVATYDYTDADGNLLYQKVRFEPKEFRQRRPHDLKWVWNIKGVEPVLYRLRDVLSAVERGETIYITEGEKDADRLTDLGVTATTSGGVGSWRQEFADLLENAHIVLVVDRDDPGLEHARKIQDSLQYEGLVETVLVVQAKTGKDVSDHLDAGYTLGELVPLELDAEDDELRLSDVVPRNVDWLFHPVIQQSAFHLLGGRGGAGKGSWLVLQAVKFTSGAYGGPKNVLWIGSEDSADQDLVPRILAAGGDTSRVFQLTRKIILPDDIEYLERKIAKVRDGLPTGMLVIDPVANHIGGKDTDGESAVRDAINELNHVSDRTRCSIFGVRHLTKYSDGGIQSVLGSTAWTDSPRVVLTMDQQHDDVRELEVVKSNRGGRGYKHLYRVVSVDIPGVEGVPKMEDQGPLFRVPFG